MKKIIPQEKAILGDLVIKIVIKINRKKYKTPITEIIKKKKKHQNITLNIIKKWTKKGLISSLI